MIELLLVIVLGVADNGDGTNTAELALELSGDTYYSQEACIEDGERALERENVTGYFCRWLGRE